MRGCLPVLLCAMVNVSDQSFKRGRFIVENETESHLIVENETETAEQTIIWYDEPLHHSDSLSVQSLSLARLIAIVIF